MQPTWGQTRACAHNTTAPLGTKARRQGPVEEPTHPRHTPARPPRCPVSGPFPRKAEPSGKLWGALCAKSLMEVPMGSL